jgi:hypothetical protein
MPFKFQIKWNTPEGAVAPQGQFWCMLKCQQCIAMTSDRMRCLRKTCRGTPYCWSHLRSERKLRIKDSNIPGAGKGLFVDSPRHGDGPVFDTNDMIVEYYAESLTTTGLDRRYGMGTHVTAPYGLTVDGGITEDGACVRGVGSIANGAMYNRRTRRYSPEPNAKYDVDRTKNVAALFATRPLYDGDEVICNYGTDYRFVEDHVTESWTKNVSGRRRWGDDMTSPDDNTLVNQVPRRRSSGVRGRSRA